MVLGVGWLDVGVGVVVAVVVEGAVGWGVGVGDAVGLGVCVGEAVWLLPKSSV